MVTVNWQGAESFESRTPSGFLLQMSSPPDEGSPTSPSPIEVFVSAAASCSGIDVISILKKMRQNVTAYRIEVEWQRGPQGVYPRPITSLILRHVVSGENLDRASVEKAVALSDEKYCGILATLRQSPAISSEFRIEDASL